jgi:DNA-binding GntR family transcriptional regulator
MPNKPKYVAIYEWLSEQIKNQAYKPGDKIPNENDLAAMFKVHRMTVRQAIDKLVSDHMLIRKRSQGTFLLSEKKPVLVRSLENISTYYDDIAAAGLQPAYSTIESGIIAADESLAASLGLKPGDEVVYLHRLMLASEVPLVLEKSFLPADLFPGILDLNINTMLYKIIDDVYNMKLMHSRQEIGATMPPDKERKLLRIPDNCPCIWVESVVYNDKGRAVEFSRALHRGDKYRFKCSIGQYLCSDVAVQAKP